MRSGFNTVRQRSQLLSHSVKQNGQIGVIHQTDLSPLVQSRKANAIKNSKVDHHCYGTTLFQRLFKLISQCI